jgi:hypothetical protein
MLIGAYSSQEVRYPPVNQAPGVYTAFFFFDHFTSTMLPIWMQGCLLVHQRGRGGVS